MSEKKRFWLYKFENLDLQSKALTDEFPYRSISIAFTQGDLSVKKKSNDEISSENGQLIFDNHTGKIQINISGNKVWGLASCECPDCNGQLQLKKKYFKIGSPSSPWFYICNNRDKGCKTVVPAKVNGTLLYIPTDKKTRNARKLTTEMFDRLWKEAPDIIDWSGDPDDMKKVLNKAKARGYRFLANEMKKIEQTETQISKMNIDQLRLAYKICKDADISSIVQYGKIY